MLRGPNVSKSFQLHTDCCSLGLETVLTQKDDFCRKYVVAYMPQSNTTVEANYTSYKGEALSAVWAIIHFRPYFYGQHFTLMTDHQPLWWLMESDKLHGKLAKWALLLQQYDCEVIHRAWITNLDVNGLSRNPSPLNEDLTGAKWHGDCDREAIPGWHAAAYFIIFSGAAIEVLIQSSNDETN